MMFRRILHLYLLTGAMAGCVFGFYRLENTVWPFCSYFAVTAWLIYLFFSRDRGLVYKSLVTLIVLQLVSVKTTALGFFFSIGFCFLMSFGIGNSSAREILFGFSNSDLLPAMSGQKEMLGVNVLAIVLLLSLLLTIEKK